MVNYLLILRNSNKNKNHLYLLAGVRINSERRGTQKNNININNKKRTTLVQAVRNSTLKINILFLMKAM